MLAWYNASCLLDRVALYDPEDFDRVKDISRGRDCSIVTDGDTIRPWQAAPGKLVTGHAPTLGDEMKRLGIKPDKDKKNRRWTRREKRNAHPVAKRPASV